MDPGTPSGPPDYYLQYTDHDTDNHGNHDSINSMSAPANHHQHMHSHSHSTSSNPAAIRLLTSMDAGGMYDDDAPSMHTSHFSGAPPQLPEIRPLASATSYVSTFSTSPTQSSSTSPVRPPTAALVPSPLSVVSKVAAAVSSLEQREKQRQRLQKDQSMELDLEKKKLVPTASPSTPTSKRPSAEQKTVKFVDHHATTPTSARNVTQPLGRSPTIKLQRKAPEETNLRLEPSSTSGLSKTDDAESSLQKSLGANTELTPRRIGKLNLAPYTDNSRLNQMASQDPFQTFAGGMRPSLDPPVMMAPPSSSYSPHRGYHGEPFRAASPTRSWSPSRHHHGGSISHIQAHPYSSAQASEYGRIPPVPAQYEPADINGSPRPGTPASQYGGSPRRPLPQAPMFNTGAPSILTSTFADDATVSIALGDDEDRSEITGVSGMGSSGFGHDHRGDTGSYRYEAASFMEDEEEEDDVFRPRSQLSGATRSRQTMYGNNYSQVTLNEAQGGHDFDEGGKDIGDALQNEGTEYDDEGSGMIHTANEKVEHYGPAPEGRQERRGVREPQTSKKAVQLIDGKLVLECKIPTILFSFLPRRDEIEFTHMRYTAVTCDPDDFVTRGYKLRQQIGRTARETELFICVTMYNENEYDFTRTMHAVMKNVSHFCGRNKSRTWGENGWHKIVVCIVSDGRGKIHPRTLDALAAMGVYQHGIAKNYVNQKAVQAHVYEYTTQVSLDSDLKFKGAEKGIVPCQMIFCLKEQNQRKLNSHRWFFNAFGRALNPNVCILLDVGTRPGNNSLYHLWKAFDTDSNVAGACGEIKAMKGRYGANLLNPLVASQNFEYKMSNILDKPLESVFGYITVLPGALSAYRYHALQNDETGHGPLSQYFKGETLHGQHADVFTANMYLAEDRILCWELVAKRGERWVLKYVKGCTGETDVPDSVPEFISQRRRWLNGAFFAAVYSLVHFKQLWLTDHTIARKMLLHIEFVYQLINLLFTYFSLANFYLTFYFVCGGLADKSADPFGHGIGNVIFIILRYTLTLLICTQFILSLGNRPQGAKRLYMMSMIIYAIIMAYTTFATFYIVIKQLRDADSLSIGNNVFTNLIVSTASTVGLYFIMSFLYLDPWHMFTSSAQYFALLPSYICTLQVYAFCNTHDVTWGTKGDNVIKTDLGGAVGKGSTVELEMPSEQLDIDSGYDEALRNLRDRIEVPSSPVSESQLQEDYYKSVRTYMVVTWMIANGILAMSVSEVYGSSGIGDNFYLRFILWAVASLALFRAIGSTTFAVINAINMIVEGRVRLSLKMPEWAGGWGSKVSDTFSSVASTVKR